MNEYVIPTSKRITILCTDGVPVDVALTRMGKQELILVAEVIVNLLHCKHILMLL
jgi:hypothetical protein